jgi:hypothetical protein
MILLPISYLPPRAPHAALTAFVIGPQSGLELGACRSLTEYFSGKANAFRQQVLAVDESCSFGETLLVTSVNDLHIKSNK